MATPLGAIVEALGGQLIGDPSLSIERLAPLATAGARDIAFVAQARYASQIASTQAGALIVPAALQAQAAARGACIVCEDPYLYFARLTQWWRARRDPLPPARVHPTAVVDPTAILARDVDVGPFAVIEPGATWMVAPLTARARP